MALKPGPRLRALATEARRRLARTTALLGASAVLIALLAVVAIGSISAGWQRERLSALCAAGLARWLGTAVAIEAIEGPLVPELAIRGLRIGDPAAPPVAIERLRVRFDLRPLLVGRLASILRLEIEGAALTVTRFADGAWGVWPSDGGDEAAEAEAEESPWGVVFQQVALRGGELRVAFEDEPTHHARLRIDVDGRGIVLPLESEQLAEWRVTLRAFEGMGSFGEPLRVDDASVDARLEGGRFSFTSAAISGSFGDVEAAGSTELAGWIDSTQPGSADLEVSLRAIDPAGLGGPKGAIDARAALTARLAVGAPFSELALAGEVVVGPSSLGGRAIRSARFVGETAGSRWSVTHSEIAGEGIDLEASGSGFGQAIDEITLRAVVSKLEAFLAAEAEDSPLSGDLELTASLSGAWQRPVGVAALRARRLRVTSFDLGELAIDARSEEPGIVELRSFQARGGQLDVRSEGVATLRLDAEGARIEGLRLVARDQRVRLDGRLTSEGFDDLHIGASGVDIDALRRFANLSLAASGQLEADFVVAGPYASPALNGALDWRDGQLDAFAFDRLRADVSRAKGGDFEVTAQVEREGRTVVDARVAVPREVPLEQLLASPKTFARLRADAFELSWIAALFPEALDVQGGTARATVELRGGPVPYAEGRLDIENASVALLEIGEVPLPLDATLVFEPHPEGIRVSDARLSVAGETLRASGVLTRSELRGVSIETGGIEVSRLAALFSFDAKVAGLLRGGLQLDGAFGQPVVTGRVAWHDARYADIDLGEVDIQVKAHDAVLEVGLRVNSAGRDLLVVEARSRAPSAPFDLDQLLRDESLHVDIDARQIPLEVARPFLPRQLRDLDGRLEARLALRGGEPSPVLEGSATLLGGRFAIPLLRQTFEPISGRFTVSRDAFRVEQLQIGSDEAGAKLSGSVGLRDLSPADLDLALSLTHFPLSRSPLLRADASGSATLAGDFGAPRLDGQLVLERASVSLRPASDPAFKEVRVLAATSDAGTGGFVETDERGNGWAQTAAVSFRLAVPRGSWIRGDGIELDVEGELELHKEPSSPASLVGSAQIVRGRYTFLGKRFDVRRGMATFDGGAVPDPILDIEAAHRVRDVTIVLFASGRASEPVIRLASEPEMSETDVISYLIVGRPADQLSGSGEGGGQGVEGAAASLAAGVAATRASRLIAEAFPIVDAVDIRIGQSGVPSQVAVGKYVSNRVFVRYGKSIGDAADEASVELKLTPHWSVESTVTSDETAGADVIWSFDY